MVPVRAVDLEALLRWAVRNVFLLVKAGDVLSFLGFSPGVSPVRF
jgi:hypothetical protein